MSTNDKVTATAEPTTTNVVETGYKAFKTYAADIAANGENVEQARQTLAESFVLTVVESRAYKTEAKRLLKAFTDVDVSSVYKTPRSARNSIIHRAAAAADRLGVRSDFDGLGYEAESQNPDRKAEKAESRKAAAKAATAERVKQDPQDSAGCLERALELLERAKGLDPSKGDDARLKRFAPAVKAIRDKRAKQAAKGSK